MKTYSRGAWNIGKTGGTVITDDGFGFKPETGHDEIAYYGGYLIAESIQKVEDAKLISAAPVMEHALRCFITGMESKEEAFPGHNMAYLLQVALPRAKEALQKAGII